MQLKPGMEEAYANYTELNDDPYGGCVVKYSEAWAEEMERRMAAGAKLEDIASQTSHDVDKRPEFGITGFMYGCAVQGLAHFWVHGEALRVWHNAQYGVKAEKGTVNPAILVAAPDDTDAN
jgi:hypothetical protein